MCINYKKHHLKNKQKLKIINCLDAQKVFVQARNLISKIRNTCFFFMLEQNVFIV